MNFYKIFLDRKNRKKLLLTFFSADKSDNSHKPFLLKCIKTIFDLMSIKTDQIPLLSEDVDFRESSNFFHQKTYRKYFRLKYYFILCLIIFIFLFFLFFVTETNENFQEIWDKAVFEPKIYQNQAFFLRPEVAKGVDCDGFFEPRNLSFSKKNNKWGVYQIDRIKFKTPDNLSTECEDIFSRHYFPSKPLTDSEKNFPIAFARIVYRDYYFLETEFATNYQPQNFYCFTIDKKSSKIFHEQIKNLSKCFPNVFYTQKEFSVDSAGHFMNIAHLECIKLLNEFNWKYVVLLQNHDFAIKTNAEMVQIFKWLNGTNDVELRRLPEKRIDKSYNYTFEDLKLFKNETRNNLSFNGFLPKLNFAKGYVEASLSKEMTNFMLNELDLSELLIRLNKRGFGVDEVLIPTLHATEAINAPGGFFHRCIEKKGGNFHFTRKSSWNGANCQSKILRHGMCVYGLEDLIVLGDYPQLFANKMIQDVDFGAFICWSERMFNRTFNINRLDPVETLNATIYLEHPAVRYNRERYLPDFDSEQFKC